MATWTQKRTTHSGDACAGLGLGLGLGLRRRLGLRVGLGLGARATHLASLRRVGGVLRTERLGLTEATFGGASSSALLRLQYGERLALVAVGIELGVHPVHLRQPICGGVADSTTAVLGRGIVKKIPGSIQNQQRVRWTTTQLKGLRR